MTEIDTPAPEVWTFHGRVRPDTIRFTLPNGLMTFDAHFANEGYHVTGTLSIKASEVVIRISSDKSGATVYDLRVHALRLVQNELDAYGFRDGNAYTVELGSAVGTDGAHLTFHNGLAELVSDGDQPDCDVEQLIGLVCSDAYFALALAEHRRALLFHADTAFHCARAIEALLNGVRGHEAAVGDSDRERKQAWLLFRESLRIDERWLRATHAVGTPLRHGTLVATSHDERVELMRNTRAIVFRYMEFVNNGRQRLDGRFAELV